MDAHVLRIDLSQNAADFEPTALEPGVPTIDRGGASYAVMRRWFGDLVAEPTWGSAGELRFFIRDGKNGRLTQAICLPATHDDLTGVCKPGVEKLNEQLQRIKPTSPREQALIRASRSALAGLGQAENEGAHEGCFVKYREPGQPWQLVWCWGYRRKDHRTATAMICTNPDCKQLFLRTAKGKTHCPGCATAAVVRDERRWRRHIPALAAIVVAAIGLALFVAGRESVGLFPRRDQLAEAHEQNQTPFTAKHPSASSAVHDSDPQRADRHDGPSAAPSYGKEPTDTASSKTKDGQTDADTPANATDTNGTNTSRMAADQVADAAKSPDDPSSSKTAGDESIAGNHPAADGSKQGIDEAGLSAGNKKNESASPSALAGAKPDDPNNTTAQGGSPGKGHEAAAASAKDAPVNELASGQAGQGNDGSPNRPVGDGSAKPVASGVNEPTITGTDAKAAGDHPSTAGVAAAPADAATKGVPMSTAAAGTLPATVSGTPLANAASTDPVGATAAVPATHVVTTPVGPALTGPTHVGAVPVAPGYAGPAYVGPTHVGNAVAAGPYVGDGLAWHDGNIVVGGIGPRSVLHRAHLLPGASIVGVNGTSLVGWTPHDVHKYFAAHPVVAGDVLDYRNADGTVGQATLPPDGPVDANAVYELRLIGVQATNLSSQSFQAALDLEVSQRGKYRLTDGKGHALGDWAVLDANARATLVSQPLARATGDDYELYIERQRGSERKLFQAVFHLTTNVE